MMKLKTTSRNFGDKYPPFPTIYEKSNIFILIGINFKKLSMSFEF